MKKTTPTFAAPKALTLKHETIRTLRDADLTVVTGGAGPKGQSSVCGASGNLCTACSGCA